MRLVQKTEQYDTNGVVVRTCTIHEKEPRVYFTVFLDVQLLYRAEITRRNGRIELLELWYDRNLGARRMGQMTDQVAYKMAHKFVGWEKT